MTVPLRSPDELRAAPALATLPALSTCIDAFVAALDLAHPCLLSGAVGCLVSDREHAARLLMMYLDACQHLLHRYDQLTFDATHWCSVVPDADDESHPDDIPF